ncbi:MAG TPA: M23 family metallopeptidase [Saprospiraceae bacterium]|nr:M23 family metallopeptidase [Saprospiraceae bacterium]
MAIQWKSIKEKIKLHLEHSFLFIIRDEDTFEETGSYRISLLNIYILASSIFVAVALILLLLIIGTPLKRLIPGYGDVRSQSEYIKLEKQLSKIDEEMRAQQTYIESLQRILGNQPQTTKDVTKDIKLVQENAQAIPKIPEDSVLRKEFEQSSRNAGSNSVQARPKTVGNTFNLSLEDLHFFPPLKGPIGASFKAEKNHIGIDIMGQEKSPIKAVLEGTVIQSDWTLESGYTISIQHANNLVSFYKHNSALLKKAGTYVKAGEAIAIIGNTGTLTNGPHLHFELWQNGKPLNPIHFINFN